MTHPLLYPWQRLFAKHGHMVDLSDVTVPERKGTENLPLVWPTEISDDDIAGMFFNAVQNTLEFAAFVPQKLSNQFRHVRDGKNGSYAIWVTSPAITIEGELCNIYSSSFGEQLSIPELFLYHIWMIDQHGKAYTDVVGDGAGYCRGTTYSKAPEKSPGIFWDPGNKVSFHHSFRDPDDFQVVHPK